jgi:sugar phosphate isomerase/epimerase
MHTTNRRVFLGALAAASLARGATEPLKLGVATYSLRKLSRADAIDTIKRLKVRYVNIKEAHLPLKSTPEEIKRGRQDFVDAGLTILGGGNISFQVDDEQDIRRKFEYAKLAGMPLIVCAPTHVTLPKLEAFVKEYNIKIAVHNHGPKDPFPAPHDALEMVKDMDPRCGLCVDIGHASEAGADVVAQIREAGPRVLDMHVKDMRNPRDMNTQVPVGDGVLPIPDIFRELIRMRYAGGVMLEYEIDPENPYPGMKKSFDYMRRTLAQIKA